MANTNRPAAGTDQDRLFWRTVHTHTRYIYESLADGQIEPNGHPQEVAVEALAIVHAMAHIALTDWNPMGAGLCAIEVEPRHEQAALASDRLIP